MNTPMVLLALAIVVIAARIGWQEGKRQGFEQGLKDAEELQWAVPRERPDCVQRGAEKPSDVTSEHANGGVPMKANYVSSFVKDRDEAMLSLDKDKILAYCQKYGVPMPKDETVFWAGVHKTILKLKAATKEQKEKSALWLEEHGFTTGIS